MTHPLRSFLTGGAAAVALSLAGCGGASTPAPPANPLDPALVRQGQAIFRNTTFGDEQFWTGTLGMNTVIQNGVSPVTALSVGLKVDSDALPADVVAAIKAGAVDLNAPATTVTLLKLNAVVGLIGKVDANNNLTQVGISCALCHSTVDNSFAPGIGHRLDGWPNRDLNPGAIIALSPAVSASQKAVYNSWGAGRFDPRFNFDGINGPVEIPPAYGLLGTNLATYTGDGDISYWNDYVAVTQMHGQGNFSDARIHVSVTSPVDLVTSTLPALKAYQLSLNKPAPPSGGDAAAIARGGALFNGLARCATCHAAPTFTDANVRLHTPQEVGQDPLWANRSATKEYRSTPLRGLASHPPYFHDGSAHTLADVVTHYNTTMALGLTAAQQSDLTAYITTL